MLSFLLDARWAALQRPCPSPAVPTTQKHQEKCSLCTSQIACLKLRTETHVSDYSLLAFLAYFLYFPLYLAGPTLSYNAWRSQVSSPQQTVSLREMLIYAFRLIAAMALLELSIHYLYFPAIAGDPRNRMIWQTFNAYELAIASYLVLKWIWLKFLVIWRFFRLWALCDGIDSPENMGRCMSNNYSLEGFWRMWHRAFNQWLVRYLFIPLGGAQYKVYNIWVVFGFVAIWHDLKLHLLVWGWGMCLFIVPEVLAKAAMRSSRFAAFRKTCLYNWLCAVTGGLYIIIMMLANLVGFSFGLPGLYTIWEEVVHGEGVSLLLQTWLLGTFVTLLMFAIRRDEGEAEPKY